MKVILFGATGMAGQGVLRECLRDEGVEAVLSVGRSTDEGANKKSAWFGLAVDHRVVDGAEAARFLETLQSEVSKS